MYKPPLSPINKKNNAPAGYYAEISSEWPHSYNYGPPQNNQKHIKINKSGIILPICTAKFNHSKRNEGKRAN